MHRTRCPVRSTFTATILVLGITAGCSDSGSNGREQDSGAEAGVPSGGASNGTGGRNAGVAGAGGGVSPGGAVGSGGLGSGGSSPIDGGAGGDPGSGGADAGSSGGTGSGGGSGCNGGPSGTIDGRVTDALQGGAALAGARVTLSNAADTAFFEARSDANGRYSFAGIVPGDYSVGASKAGREYEETQVTLATCSGADFSLGAETNRGRWETLGDAGERLGGTNSGVLLPDGRVMFCHDTLDPVIWNPVTRTSDAPGGSNRRQGCHAVSLLPTGELLYVGGTDQPVYGPGTKQVKTFDPVTKQWTVRPDMVGERWYASLVPLPSGEMLAVGGGGLANPIRVRTSEVMDPVTRTWAPVGDISIGNEVSPIVLLHTGEVLMTHRPPQLYSPSSKSWRLADDFIQANRMSNGDHADHELVLLPNGEVAAIGFMSFVSGDDGQLLELYDPVANSWRLGASFEPVRSRASTVLLPDGKVLLMGGKKADSSDPTPVNAWGQVALTDLYDPALDSWRRLDDMSYSREYHATPVLVPDGRVVVAGGEGEPGNPPAASFVEAFSPPYLFRGPRPEMSALSSTTLRRGDTVTFTVAKTNAPSAVIAIGTIASTHFMDSGNGRYLDLQFTQSGAQVTATIPAQAARAVFGYYTMIVLVDGIPSAGRVFRIVQ